jgi:hypothetical protein
MEPLYHARDMRDTKKARKWRVQIWSDAMSRASWRHTSQRTTRDVVTLTVLSHAELTSCPASESLAEGRQSKPPASYRTESVNPAQPDQAGAQRNAGRRSNMAPHPFSVSLTAAQGSFSCVRVIRVPSPSGVISTVNFANPGENCSSALSWDVMPLDSD